MRVALITALLVVLDAMALSSAHAQNYLRPVVKVPGTAANLAMPDDPPPQPPKRAREPDPAPGEEESVQCISIDDIRDADIRSDRVIRLRMRGNVYYEMRLQNNCPGLSFYDGFYYRTTPNRQLCGGLDMIMARSGSRCPIESFVRINPKQPADADDASSPRQGGKKEKAGRRKD
ncbi:hypothetical protein [Pedomonas sp. V897]|uniref:hypothetical protein n=1 Tax=Pedomonas sp. V897 TaxID=3446482 RepID=UPI003EE10213